MTLYRCGIKPDMGYYSDNGVDHVLSTILPDFGYAVDVGASNGVFNSNTLHFEEKGWEVLCIEANPRLAEEGRKRRKRWREVACGKENGVGEFWIVGEHRPWASGSALAVNGRTPYSDSSASPGWGHVAIPVPIRNLDELIEEAEFPRVDFLTIDVEGSELDVLAGFSLERWKPQIICIEEYPEEKMSPPPGYDKYERRLYDTVFLRRENG